MCVLFLYQNSIEEKVVLRKFLLIGIGEVKIKERIENGRVTFSFHSLIRGPKTLLYLGIEWIHNGREREQREKG